MLLQRVNKNSAEKVFVVAKNSWATASLSNGQAVAWDHQTDADGIGVTKPGASATAAGVDIAGVAAQTIAAGDYGLIQVYGYHSAARVRTMTTTTNGAVQWKAVATGTPLTGPLAAAFCLEACGTGSATILRFPVGFALAPNALFTTAAVAVFLKCL